MMMAILVRVWMTGYESANLADVASFVLGLGIGMACRNEVLSPPKVWGAPVQVHVVSPRIFHRIGSA